MIDLDDLPPTRVFGTWDAAITDGAERIDVPTDLACVHCGLHFIEGDNGAIMPTGYAAHRECSLRGVVGGIGHLVDHDRYCKGELGTDAGLTYRQSAWLAWGHFTGEREPVTVAELEILLKIEGRAS